MDGWSDFSYYLPEILLAILVTIALGWVILVIRDLFRRSKGGITCLHCKGVSNKISRHPYLFLLPISFGDKYEHAASYLPSHMIPISRKEEIPTGRRACWVEVYSCPQCDTKQVLITDFLQVRGTEHLEGSYHLPYEPFYSLIEAWKQTQL